MAIIVNNKLKIIIKITLFFLRVYYITNNDLNLLQLTFQIHALLFILIFHLICELNRIRLIPFSSLKKPGHATNHSSK